MKIQDNYEKVQVRASYQILEKSLSETRNQISGAVFRTNFGGSGTHELLEAHNTFKEIERLLNEASVKLKTVGNMI